MNRLQPREAVIEGRATVVVDSQTTLPKSLSTLLDEMAPFGFAEKQDFALAGARTACEVLRVHRWKLFRVGRWMNPRSFSVVIGPGRDGVPATETVPRGLRHLRLDMCADCGAVMVRDVFTHDWMGARPVRLVNTSTGAERTAPAQGRRDLVIGWYSGKRRAGREYR